MLLFRSGVKPEDFHFGFRLEWKSKGFSVYFNFRAVEWEIAVGSLALHCLSSRWRFLGQACCLHASMLSSSVSMVSAELPA